MGRKKILWLVSWYPNRNDRFDGDFIQRHARAAALFNDIHVIFVTDASIEKDIEEEWNEEKGLTEQIIYFKKKKGISGRISKQLKWRRLYLDAVKNYLEKNGKPDWVHVHVPWKAGLIAMILKRKYGLDYLVTEHWAIYNSSAIDAFYKRKKYFQYLTKSIIGNAEKLLAVSYDLGKSIEKFVVKKNFEVIPNVVDCNFFYFNPKGNDKKFRFIHVSTMLEAQKKPRDLINAFIAIKKEFENIELYMIGPRPKDLYEYVLTTSEVDKSIYFVGEVVYQNVAKELQKANTFVLCSKYENQPCAILEALCCGLPVIATGVGGVPELVNKENGILIQPGNVAALTQAMKKIIQNHSVYNREKISEEAKAKYNYERVGKMFDEAYKKN